MSLTTARLKCLPVCRRFSSVVFSNVPLLNGHPENYVIRQHYRFYEQFHRRDSSQTPDKAVIQRSRLQAELKRETEEISSIQAMARKCEAKRVDVVKLIDDLECIAKDIDLQLQEL